MKCRPLDGQSKRAVLKKLGPAGLPDDETPEDERNTWVFYLGPDGLHIDDDVMYVTFDRYDRVSEVAVGQT